MAVWGTCFLLLVVLIYTVTGVSLTIRPSNSLAEGKTLEVTCDQPNLGQDTFMYTLGLKRFDSTSGTYRDILRFVYEVQPQAYSINWGNTEWRDRSNISNTFDGFRGGSFTLSVGRLKRSDSSSLICEVNTSDRDNLVESSPIQNVTVYALSTSPPPSTRRPLFQRDKPIVRNITQTEAVLLIDMRDPPTQLVSTGYNLRCERRLGEGLLLNINIEKKDASWGNGTARFTLTGLSPGQVYKCQASSRTPLGPGWIDEFGFMTSPKEVKKTPNNQFSWHHAVGLGSVGLLLLLGVFITQNRSP